MLSLTNSPLLKLQLLQSAGGCLQHARGLLSLLTIEGAGSCNGATGSSSPSAGRFISTTRGIYMGRVFIRENLVKSATPSALYTRDNYQFLAQNRWSLAACEQVLAKHAQSTGRRARKERREHAPFDPINKALNNRINATTNLNELRVVVEEQAHRMTQINMAVVIQKVPQLLFSPKAQPDFDAAAVLLDHVAGLLQPKLQYLSGANICGCLASFSKCRYTPSGEILQSMTQQLLDNGAKKLKTANLISIGQLMVGSSRMVHPQGQWSLHQAVLEETTDRLTTLLKQQQDQMQQTMHVRKAQATQQQEQQEDPAGQSSAGATQEPGSSSSTIAESQAQSEVLPAVSLEQFRTANSLALIAWCLDCSQVSSPEYSTALHEWIAHPLSLRGLTAIGAVQLWNAVRGHYTRQYRMRAATAAAGDSSSSTAGPNDQPEEREPTAAAAAAVDVNEDEAASSSSDSSSSSSDSMAQQQITLQEFFGPQTLDNLAAATAQLITQMTERELGQVLSSVSAIRYYNEEFLAAAAAGFDNICKNMQPSIRTLVSAAWAAAVLQTPKPALMQPVLIAAVAAPGRFDGVMAGRLLRLTSMLSAEELQNQQVLLRQELHRRSDARGPPPTAEAAAQQLGENLDWVASIADDISQRIATLKPWEIAQLISAFSQIPGVVLHEGLFEAAAAHIETHAHTFTKFREMELVASAFEAMNYTKGLPALKALQQQSELLAAKQL